MIGEDASFIRRGSGPRQHALTFGDRINYSSVIWLYRAADRIPDSYQVRVLPLLFEPAGYLAGEPLARGCLNGEEAALCFNDKS